MQASALAKVVHWVSTRHCVIHYLACIQIPTRDVIYFPKANFQVYNIAGQKIADEQGKVSFDLSAHLSGLYLMTFRDDDGQVIQQSKIVKY